MGGSSTNPSLILAMRSMSASTDAHPSMSMRSVTWTVARCGACAARSATAGATVEKDVAGVDVQMAQQWELHEGWVAGGRLELKLSIKSVRSGMAMYAMHSRMPLIRSVWMTR